MPEYPIRDSILSSLTAQEPWPDNVKLFQPYEVEQILLPDNASCLAVQAFLKMCNLPFEVEMRWNAEFMSPSGRVPFIKCGAFVVSELEPIAQFAANKGVSLCSRLSTEDKAEMRAYMSLITNVLVNAELYISWIDNETFNQVTKVRNSSVYPWPLGWLQTRAKRNSVAKRLKALHWHDKTLDQVLADVEQCCNSLSQRLGDKSYFFGTPTPLDALVYGHIRALLSAHGPRAALMIRPITTALLHLVIRVGNLTGLPFTAQEEYLLREAFSPNRRSSPIYSDKSRAKYSSRSSSMKRQSGDSINVFGKPFASKKLIVLNSKRGIICKHGKFPIGNCIYVDEEEFDIITELIEDIFDNVQENVYSSVDDKLAKNIHEIDDKNGFEVIAFPNQLVGLDSKNVSLDKLDEITEPTADASDISISIDEGTDVTIEEIVHVEQNTHEQSNDETVVIETDENTLGPSEENMVEDNVIVTEIVPDNDANENFHTPELTDSSPTELDALVFGHVFTIITTRLPCRRLAEVVRKHEALVALAKRVDEQYFKRP